MRVRSLVAVVAALSFLGFVVAIVAGGLHLRGSGPDPVRVDRDAPPPSVAPLADGTDAVVWARDHARAAGIPRRALQAYANAELRQRRRTPDCRLSWATLAGIGRVESRHAHLRGPGPDGRADPPIIGIPLDGRNGTRRVADTDGGRLDGDPVLDRAVGPMQFLPETWARFGADGNGDGVADPQQVDDAALAAAGYLCSNGRDATDGGDWWAAVLAYNNSVTYAGEVWTAAAQYAQQIAPRPARSAR